MSQHYEIVVRECHLDTFGHMNNATYLQIYEEARWELITDRGFGLEEIKKSGVGPVILEVNVKFNKEICLREKIHVTTNLLEYVGKIGKLQQQMVKPDGTVASEAIFTFALFDTKSRKIISPTPEWKKAVGLQE